MKRTSIIFWSVTILFCFFMLFSAVPEFGQTSEAKAFMSHLGYPNYINPFLATLKVLGVIALLVPGYPRIKEWAYAGFFFDLLGATYSQIATDGFLPQVAFMLIPFVLLALSYNFSHRLSAITKPAVA